MFQVFSPLLREWIMDSLVLFLSLFLWWWSWNTFLHSFIRSFIHWFVHWSIRWFFGSYTHTHTHIYIYIRTYIHQCMHYSHTHRYYRHIKIIKWEFGGSCDTTIRGQNWTWLRMGRSTIWVGSVMFEALHSCAYGHLYLLLVQQFSFCFRISKGKHKVIWESTVQKVQRALDILQEILRVGFFSVCLKDSHRSGCLTSYTHGQPWSKPCFDMDVGSNPAAANNIRLKKNHSYFLHTNLLVAPIHSTFFFFSIV